MRKMLSREVKRFRRGVWGWKGQEVRWIKLSQLCCWLLPERFVCLTLWDLTFHSRNFSLIWGVTISDEGLYLYSIPMTIEQWEFFSVPHLATLTRGIHLYGLLREPVIFTPVAEHLAVELSLTVFTTYMSQPEIKPQSLE